MSSTGRFAFADLFAGIGGFHAALSALGGELAIAAEKDVFAAATYKRNWGVDPVNDVVDLANSDLNDVADFDVLAGGFPCQPFSKSGRQRGMREERGQVFDEMLKIITAKQPALVVLENVRNLAGQRHTADGVWDHVIGGLRAAGYSVADQPWIVSPHRVPPWLGGAPQSRDRVFILGTHVGTSSGRVCSQTPASFDDDGGEWSPSNWDLFDGYVERGATAGDGCRCTTDEMAWLDAWDDFLRRTDGIRLPSHPLWSDYWHDDATVTPAAPRWKTRFEEQNIAFWRANRSVLRAWQRANPGVARFPQSRRKFEWQAGETPRRIDNLLVHLRPSGVRVKAPTYAPALVAMAQTPIIGQLRRKMTPREAARLQGVPEWFQLDHQPDQQTFKQLGNAVNLGVAYFVVRNYVLANADLLASTPGGSALVSAVGASASDPRPALNELGDR